MDRYDRFMSEALIEARKAFEIGEVPIGAVVVKDDVIVGRGYNRRETDRDPTAHAEIIAIRSASEFLGGWRLTGCELYVTIEPCPMCAGAIVMSRLQKVIYGSPDEKAGAVNTLYEIVNDARLNHQVEVVPSIMSQECSAIISEFFKTLRKAKRK